MTEAYLVEPDLDFINEVGALGGEDLKKCYQCATCSSVCELAPEDAPFPRRQVLWAQWGLVDRLATELRHSLNWSRRFRCKENHSLRAP